MRRDLIIGLLASVLIHGGMGWGTNIWAALFPKKSGGDAQTQVAQVTLWVPPPLPEIPPDPDELVDLKEDLATLAPPSLLDVPSDVRVDSFVEVMAPPPPPTLGKPDPGMMTVPRGDFGQGRLQSDLGHIFNLADLDQQPEPRGMRAIPVFPSEMKRQGITGEVTVEFIVDAQGDVRDVTVKSSTHREFETPAIQAVQKWKFRPGKRAGKAVSVRINQPISFKLNEDE